MPNENGNTVSVAQRIRDYRKDKPRASNKSIAEALSSDDGKVSAHYVSEIRRAKPAKRRTKKKKVSQRKNKRVRQTRRFPAAAFEDSLVLAIGIHEHAPVVAPHRNIGAVWVARYIKIFHKCVI